MPRIPKPWFRFYVETIEDDKLAVQPPAICWLWTVIMALARRSPDPGYLLLTGTVAHTAESLAAKSRVPLKQVEKALAYFTKVGMLHEDGGCLVVANFAERQFESNSSTERARKARRLQRGSNDVATGLADGLQHPLTENREQNPPNPPSDNLLETWLTECMKKPPGASRHVKDVVEGKEALDHLRGYLSDDFIETCLATIADRRTVPRSARYLLTTCIGAASNRGVNVPPLTLATSKPVKPPLAKGA